MSWSVQQYVVVGFVLGLLTTLLILARLGR
jgi:hypothetical protein